MKYFQLSKYLYHQPKDRSYSNPWYINRTANVVCEEFNYGSSMYSYDVPEYLELELFKRQYEAATKNELSERELTTLRYLFDAYLLQFMPDEGYKNYLVELKTDEDFEREKVELKETATEFPKRISYCKDIWDWDAKSVTREIAQSNDAVPYILCLLREEVSLSDPDVLLRFQRKKEELAGNMRLSTAPKTRQQMADMTLYKIRCPLRSDLGGSIFRGFLEVYMEPILKASVKDSLVTATIWDLQGCFRKQEGTYNLQLRPKDVLFAPDGIEVIRTFAVGGVRMQ